MVVGFNTANTVRAFAFLRRELDDIGIVVNPAKTVVLPPKGHAPMTGEISLLESVDVRIADEGGVTVVGAPIGTDEYVLERVMGVVSDRGTGRLARCLGNVPDKQAAALIAIESFGQRTSYLERTPTRDCLSKLAGGQTTGPGGRTREASSHRARRRHSRFFQDGCPDNRLTLLLHKQSPSTTFYGREKIRAAVDGREANVCASIGSKVGILPEVLADLLIRCETGRGGGSQNRALSLSSEVACGDSRHMGDSEGSDDRHRPRILAGMGSRHRGGPGPKAPRGRHARGA